VRRFLIVFPATVGLVVIAALALPMGEYVDLITVDDDGRRYHSAVWVAELDGVPHLRSGWPDSHWLERLSTHPLVEVERAGQRRHYRAVVVDDPAVRGALNAALAEEHGVADRAIRLVVDMSRAVPVRLEPIEGLDDARFEH
jgi:hypothetical protein